jgi:DNA-directed RNA polymerase subunit RPC12/RpoP
LTSGTFTRVRLFTDIEDITLDKRLNAANSGQDELAKKILDTGLLVANMIAEIPLDQNLADNSELKQLADNANTTFGLIVCFGCNRAFDNKDEQVKNCPNCGTKISLPELTPRATNKNTSEKAKKQAPPLLQKTKKQVNHKESEKPEKQPVRKGKHSPSTPGSPSHTGDEAKEETPVFLDLDHFKQHWTSGGKTRPHSATSSS